MDARPPDLPSRAYLSDWERAADRGDLPQSLKTFAGRLDVASMLSRLIYWGGKVSRPTGFYKSDSELATEATLTPAQVRRLREKLVACSIVRTSLRKANGAPTLHYTLDWDVLDRFIEEHLKSGLPLIKLANPFIKLTNRTNDSQDKYLRRSLIKETKRTHQFDKSGRGSDNEAPPGYQIDKSLTKTTKDIKNRGGEGETGERAQPYPVGRIPLCYQTWLDTFAPMVLEPKGIDYLVRHVTERLDLWKATLDEWAAVPTWSIYNVAGMVERYQKKLRTAPAPSVGSSASGSVASSDRPDAPLPLKDEELELFAQNVLSMLKTGYLLEHVRAKFRGSIRPEDWDRLLARVEFLQSPEGASEVRDVAATESEEWRAALTRTSGASALKLVPVPKEEDYK